MSLGAQKYAAKVAAGYVTPVWMKIKTIHFLCITEQKGRFSAVVRFPKRSPENPLIQKVAIV